MARIKVRFVLNRGRHGAPMAKLGKISEQAEKFLRSLATDCDIETRPGEWLAANFKNGSVEFDGEFQGDVPPGAPEVFARNLEVLADFVPEEEGLNSAISSATALEYARIGGLIDPDEEIGLGIYSPHRKEPKMRTITYNSLAVIRRQMETPLQSYGAVQGILHSWHKEAKEPSFQLRELSTEALVRVIYPASLYQDVAEAVEERTTMLIVEGNMLFDRTTNLAVQLRADRIDKMRLLSTAEFEEFFGSAPEYIANFDDDDDVRLDG